MTTSEVVVLGFLTCDESAMMSSRHEALDEDLFRLSGRRAVNWSRMTSAQRVAGRGKILAHEFLCGFIPLRFSLIWRLPIRSAA
jgi:hypothetical protein